MKDQETQNEAIPTVEGILNQNEPAAEETSAQENSSLVNDENETITENESAISLEEKVKLAEDKYLRLYADFENHKRRTSAERIELFKTANQEVLVSLLPVLDDFSRALKAMQTANDITSIKEGMELVNHKFNAILANKGLKPMESAGKDFDVNFHEAITNIPAPTEDLKGKVVDEVEKGYFLNEKVIRFAKVVVGE